MRRTVRLTGDEGRDVRSTRLADRRGRGDLADFMCGSNYDVPLCSAAFLSARFPFVNPSGRIEARCEGQNADNRVASVVNGGHLDVSGASSVSELMEALRLECVGVVLSRTEGIAEPGRQEPIATLVKASIEQPFRG